MRAYSGSNQPVGAEVGRVASEHTVSLPMADGISSAEKGLHCPYEVFDEDFFSQIVREYAVSLLSMCIDRYPLALTPDPAPMSSMLAHPLATDYSPFWCPELGHCLTALKANDPSKAIKGVGQILLNLTCRGVPGGWGIRLQRPCRFHWDYVLWPEVESLEVESDGRKVLISARGAGGKRELTFHVGDTAVQWPGPEAETIPHLTARKFPILLLTRTHLEQFELPLPEYPIPDEITSSQLEDVSSCLTFLREHLPTFGFWVERVLRYLCLVQSPSGSMHSGSFEGHFGFAFMSTGRNLLKMAEMLIHECSHQYFFLLTRFAALTDDDRLYYSPFVGKERPADRLLLAYHAFANVELFYRACSRAGISASDCEAAIAQFRPDLDSIERALTSEVRFTSAGSGLIDSLLASRSKYEFAD